MPAAIEIEGLSKSYGHGDEATMAVDALDLEVKAGEIFGFLGPNGAGKTTTVQMLVGLVFPDGGKACLLGKPLGDLEARASIGYLPETFDFHGFLRAREFLEFHAGLYGVDPGEREQRIGEVLELMDLQANADSRLRTFSRGMLQRIGIAQALINRPRLLFLDEPTSALDPMGRRQMRDIILSLRDRGTTIFLNSHLLSEVEMTCDRVGIINHGRLVRVASLPELTSPRPCVEVDAVDMGPEIMSSIEAMALRVEQREGRLLVWLEDESQVNRLAEIIVSGGASLRSFTPRQRSLEEAFIQAIEEDEQ